MRKETQTEICDGGSKTPMSAAGVLFFFFSLSFLEENKKFLERFCEMGFLIKLTKQIRQRCVTDLNVLIINYSHGRHDLKENERKMKWPYNI